MFKRLREPQTQAVGFTVVSPPDTTSLEEGRP